MLPVDERAAFLDAACDDGRRRGEVEALLAADDSSDAVNALLDAGPDASWLALNARLGGSVAGVRIGDYELRRVLAHGGMGTVYEAEQQQPRRTVALKMLRLGMSASAARRFQVEAEILGQLRHPSIAKVFGAGFVRDGVGERVPYFAMELVEGGQPLTTAADERGLDLRARLELFLAVCEGVQHSHEHGVIHRDLKPENILLDAAGRPRLIDFGIARLAAGGPPVTSAGELLGTLQYMSPEQLLGAPDLVDVRSDVYALGVILHELCCGRPPHELEGLAPARAAEWLRDAGPPSARALRPELSMDLEWVIARAADPDRERRYPSAAAFTEDLRRLLRDEPVLAGAPDAAYQVRRFVRRHRLALGAAAAVLVVLVGGLVAVGLALVRAREAEARQAQALQLAEERLGQVQRESARTAATNDFFESMLLAAEPEAQGRDVRVADLLDVAANGLAASFAAEPAIEASLQDTCGRLYLGLGLHESAEKHLRRALSIRRSILPADAPDTLGTLERLARVLQRQGRLDEAGDLLREVVDGRTALHGERDPDTLLAQSSLGGLLGDRGELQAAEALLRPTLALQREILGERDEATLSTTNRLADVLIIDNRPAEAEPLYRSVIETLKAAGRPDHPTALNCANGLADVLRQLGRDDEAEALLRTTLQACRRTLGPDHPRTSSTASRLARLLLYRGAVDECIALQTELLATPLRLHGPAHRDTVAAKHNLGVTLTQCGRAVEAEPLLREAAASAATIWGARHIVTGTFLDDLGRCLVTLERYDEAEPLLIEAHDMLLETMGPDHPNTRQAADDLARLQALRN